MSLSRKIVTDWGQGFNSIINSTYNGLLAIDSNGCIILANEAARNIIGLKEDLTGILIHDIVPESRLFEVAKTGNAQIGHKVIINNHEYLMNITPILQEEEILGAVAVFEDAALLSKISDKANSLRAMLDYYKEQLDRVVESKYSVDQIVGKSQIINQLREAVKKMAPSNTTILIRGESGTGKELFARALHAKSPRRDMPFIKVNCASVPEQVLEQELFGNETNTISGKGKSRQIGKFELAQGGTLFFCEISDISLNLQSKILEFLQKKTVQRIGSHEEIELDVRIITSTNRNLEDLMHDNMFKEELYYSLNAMSFYLPPLRDRKEDIEPLINHFIDKYNMEFGKKVLSVSSEVYNVLINHTWPGNVRELEMVMERVINVVEDQTIEIYHLPVYLKKVSPVQVKIQDFSLRSILEETEKRILKETLENTGDNKVKAAKILGISRAGLYQKLEKYNLLTE